MSGPPLTEMIGHFRKIQDAERLLLIRGSFSPNELHLLMDTLDPKGLFLLIMVQSMAEIDGLKPIVGM